MNVFDDLVSYPQVAVARCRTEYPKVASRVARQFGKLNARNLYDYFHPDAGQCEKCGKGTRFLSVARGYTRYCGVKCAAGAIATVKARKATCLVRYGVDVPAKSALIKEKIQTTCLP
jgi:hypothetical protein